MTRTIRIAQAGIFSDLNNLEIHAILEEDYDKYLDLLENEVEQAIKEWYNGYKFGSVDVYNPLSMLKYLKSKKLGAYWINTSGNLLIKRLLMKSDSKVLDTLL